VAKEGLILLLYLELRVKCCIDERGVANLLCSSTIGCISSIRGCVYACEMPAIRK